MGQARTPRGGYGIVGRVGMRMRGPSYGAKANYALLCTYTGDAEYCFPSIETQAEDLGVSVATIKRWHKELEKFGIIDKGKLVPGGWDRRNKYEIFHPDPIETHGLTDEPMQCITGEPIEQLAGEPIEQLTHEPLILTHNNNSKNTNSVKPTSFTRRVTDLIGQAHHHLMKQPLEWEAKGAAYGKAVQSIIKIVSKEPDEEKAFQKVREKCAAYVAEANNDAFWKKQGLTPVSLLAAWNKIHYTGQQITDIAPKKFPDWRTMTPDQIRIAFDGWNKSFTVLDLQENLPPETFAAYQSAGGYAPRLADILIAANAGGVQ